MSRDGDPATTRLPDQSHGGVHFLYGGQASRFIDYTASVLDVESALRNMTAFRHDSDFGHVNVTSAFTSGSSGSICAQNEVVNTTIDLRSEYGNLHELDIVDAMEFGNQVSNWTMIGPKATTKSLVCSNRGVCDETTGQCKCFFDTGFGPVIERRMMSSVSLRGREGPGEVGDGWPRCCFFFFYRAF